MSPVARIAALLSNYVTYTFLHNLLSSQDCFIFSWETGDRTLWDFNWILLDLLLLGKTGNNVKQFLEHSNTRITTFTVRFYRKVSILYDHDIKLNLILLNVHINYLSEGLPLNWMLALNYHIKNFHKFPLNFPGK